MNAAAKKSAPVLADAQLLELSPSDILIPERIGFLHEDKAAALGRLMAVDGQRDPIKIVRYLPSKSIEQCVSEGKAPWRLVTGMHRLMGATYEGITIFAIEVSGKAEDLADLEAFQLNAAAGAFLTVEEREELRRLHLNARLGARRKAPLRAALFPRNAARGGPQPPPSAPRGLLEAQ